MKHFIAIVMIALLGMTAAGTGYASNDEDGKQDKKQEEVEISSVKGQIIDERTGEGLAGVSIRLAKADKVVYTDFDGKFNFSGVKAGKHDLEISYLSYQNEYHKSLNFDPGKTFNLEFKLKPVER